MKFASLATTVVAAAGALSVATSAMAQDYRDDAPPPPPQPRPDCAQVVQNHSTTGTILGALAGAALGSNMASHHGGRSGGAAIGGVAGALVGNQIGRSAGQDRCYGYAPAPQGYYRPAGGYAYAPPPPPPAYYYPAPAYYYPEPVYYPAPYYGPTFAFSFGTGGYYRPYRYYGHRYYGGYRHWHH